MHPSNAFTIEELNANLEDILHACEQDVQKLIGRKDVQLDLCSKIENGKLRINWDASYDFEARDIRYTVELARDFAISDVVFKAEDVLLPEVTCDAPDTGQYFVRVRATNSDGYTQDAFDYYVTDDGKQYGMKCFYVQDGGKVVEDTYEEG